jgi:hypothetical protein
VPCVTVVLKIRFWIRRERRGGCSPIDTWEPSGQPELTAEPTLEEGSRWAHLQWKTTISRLVIFPLSRSPKPLAGRRLCALPNWWDHLGTPPFASWLSPWPWRMYNQGGKRLQRVILANIASWLSKFPQLTFITHSSLKIASSADLGYPNLSKNYPKRQNGSRQIIQRR